ncbi:MAG: hypothetical protein AAFQ17_00535, partial [Pseudomonadota bacterium]
FVVAEPDTPFSAVTGTEYWAHVRGKLQVFDVIEIVAADGSFDAEIRLLSITPTKLTWRVLRKTEGSIGEIVKPAAGPTYKAVHRGRGSYAVQHQTTGDLIADGLTKEQAEAEVAKAEIEKQAA